jgi:hypothetical protein
MNKTIHPVDDVVANLNRLPEKCMVWIPDYGIGGLVHRGFPGYTPFPSIRSEDDVTAFNARRGLDPADVEAMHCGSMFGWHIPAANPDNHR